MDNTKKHYVAGFMFNDTGSQVALVEKKKFPPGFDWTSTPLNAIGGKIEDEYPEVAMIREFKEETGVDTNRLDWSLFLKLSTSNWVVWFFRGFSTQHCLNVQTTEEERILVCSTSSQQEKWVPNLHWIVPMALTSDVIFSDVIERD
jgi:8-oxo-dGTP diphosphatase